MHKGKLHANNKHGFACEIADSFFGKSAVIIRMKSLIQRGKIKKTKLLSINRIIYFVEAPVMKLNVLLYRKPSLSS